MMISVSALARLGRPGGPGQLAARAVNTVRALPAWLGRRAVLLARGAAPLLFAGAVLLPPAWLGALDRLLGRPGGALLLLALVLLVAQACWRRRPAAGGVPEGAAAPAALLAPAPLATILEHQMALDAAIGERLDAINADTESAALAIVGNVRALYDSASLVVRYLDSSGMQADELGKEISDSVSYLVEIGGFIGAMPPKLERDLRNVACVVEEITAMSALVEGVQAISMQSHMLSINAAIEAARAGRAGASFAVLARQMRTLAADSQGVASRINAGLARARAVIEGGMATGLAESSAQLGQVAHAVASIDKLKDNFEDMSQYYKTRFAVVSKHNEDLAGDISAALGQIQHQDVVRQTIERIKNAIAARRALQGAVIDGAVAAALPAALALVTADYLEEELRHGAPGASGAGGPPAFELF